MKYLLDTCVISEVLRPIPDMGVVDWMDSCEGESLFLSVLTLGEVQKGIDKLPPGHRRNALQKWIDVDLSRTYSGRVIPVDREVAVTWGHLQAKLEKVGMPMPLVDGLLCATALAHNLVVVTRNTKDFAPTGVQLLNPWT